MRSMFINFRNQYPNIGLPFIVWSNVFLLFPILISYSRKEWIYFVMSFGIFVASIIFHIGHEYHEDKHLWARVAKYTDWFFAIAGSAYVFYYIFKSPIQENKIILAILFLGILLFFLYGYLLGNYNKLHPWFHVFGQILLGFIILLL